MSDLAIAAVLAGTILVASTISVEIGLSVALIELAAGVVVGNSFNLDRPELAELHRLVRGDRADLPRRAPRSTCRNSGASGRRRSRSGFVSFFAPFAVVGLLAYYGLGWNHRQAEIAGHRALDDEPRRRLRGARRDRPEPRARSASG